MEQQRRRHRVGRIGTWVAVPALALVLLAGVVLVAQRGLIYFPDRAAPPPTAPVPPGTRDVALHTEDGLELTAWLVPASEEADTGVAVLYLPGNGATARGAPGPPGCSPSGD